jgi:hypothetical protein
MATEPKNIREVHFILEGLEGRLALVLKMTWGVIGLLGALLAGAAALYSQIGDIKSDVAVLKSNGETLKGQQAAIQDALRSTETKVLGPLSEIRTALVNQNQLSPNPPRPDDAPLNLSADEIAFLRESLQVKRKGDNTLARIGEVVPTSAIMPLIPASVTDKIPRLKGYRYTLDAGSGALLIVSRSLRVAEIIEPA